MAGGRAGPWGQSTQNRAVASECNLKNTIGIRVRAENDDYNYLGFSPEPSIFSLQCNFASDVPLPSMSNGVFFCLLPQNLQTKLAK